MLTAEVLSSIILCSLKKNLPFPWTIGYATTIESGLFYNTDSTNTDEFLTFFPPFFPIFVLQHFDVEKLSENSILDNNTAAVTSKFVTGRESASRKRSSCFVRSLSFRGIAPRIGDVHLLLPRRESSSRRSASAAGTERDMPVTAPEGEGDAGGGDGAPHRAGEC